MFIAKLWESMSRWALPIEDYLLGQFTELLWGLGILVFQSLHLHHDLIMFQLQLFIQRIWLRVGPRNRKKDPMNTGLQYHRKSSCTLVYHSPVDATFGLHGLEPLGDIQLECWAQDGWDSGSDGSFAGCMISLRKPRGSVLLSMLAGVYDTGLDTPHIVVTFLPFHYSYSRAWLTIT